KILANKLRIYLKMPCKEDFIDVSYSDFDGKDMLKFNKIGETNSWNYHKGCRLQWLSDNNMIFNCTDNGKMVSNIVDIESLKKVKVSYPIDSVSYDGKLATSFSYERLEKFMPGYGYNHSDDISFVKDKAPSKTGLFLVDLK